QLIIRGQRGRLQASCLSPCGPAFGCSILFQQNCPCPYPLVWSHPNDAIGFGKRRAGTNGPKKQWRLRRHGFIERATRAKTKNKKQKTKNKNQKKISGRRPQKTIQVAAVFPAHSGQPAGKKIW